MKWHREALCATCLLLAAASLSIAAEAQKQAKQPAALLALSGAEIDGLTLVRLNAKFARDLFEEFHRSSNLPILGNMRRFEQRRMNVVAKLRKKYKLKKPVGEAHEERQEGRLRLPRATPHATGLRRHHRLRTVVSISH